MSLIVVLVLAAAAWCVISYAAYACAVVSSRSSRALECGCARRADVRLPERHGGVKVAELCLDCGRQVYYAPYLYGTGNSRSRHD